MKITIELRDEIAMRLIKGECNILTDLPVSVEHDIHGASREDIVNVINGVLKTKCDQWTFDGVTSHASTAPQPAGGQQRREGATEV